MARFAATLLLAAFCATAAVAQDITTFAGGGGGATPATAILLVWPQAVAIGPDGSVYIAEGDLNRVRKVDAATGSITIVAGSGDGTFSGDGGPATAAGLRPLGLAVGADGDLYIATGFHNRIRKVDSATGIITTVAGSGLAGTAS